MNNKLQIITIGSELYGRQNLKFIKETNGEFTYELNALSQTELYGVINDEIKEENIPFDKIIIINEGDTTSLNNRSEIANAMVEKGKDYYAIIIE